MSFPRNGDDLHYARKLAADAGCYAKIVAKVERAEAVETQEALEDIILASDVVMVARGDLGVEIGDARLVGVQKKHDPHNSSLKPCGYYCDTDDGVNGQCANANPRGSDGRCQCGT